MGDVYEAGVAALKLPRLIGDGEIQLQREGCEDRGRHAKQAAEGGEAVGVEVAEPFLERLHRGPFAPLRRQHRLLGLEGRHPRFRSAVGGEGAGPAALQGGGGWGMGNGDSCRQLSPWQTQPRKRRRPRLALPGATGYASWTPCPRVLLLMVPFRDREGPRQGG